MLQNIYKELKDTKSKNNHYKMAQSLTNLAILYAEKCN